MLSTPVEIWQPIPRHKGYEASNLGRIRSLDRWLKYKTGARRFYKGRILRQFTPPHGYKTTHLGSQHINNYVHVLVARAFLGPCPKGMEVCHNDGNKANPRLDNLRYDTKSGNALDVIRHRYEQAWSCYASQTMTN